MKTHIHSHFDNCNHHEVCSYSHNLQENHIQKEEYTQTLDRDGNLNNLESSEKNKTEENENLIIREPVETVRKLLETDEYISSDDVLIEMQNKQIKKN